MLIRRSNLFRPLLSILAALLVVGLALSIGGCADSTQQIGVVLPLTGDAAPYGVAIRKGVELAFDKLQAAGDYPHPLALSVVDSESQAATAATLLETQYQEGALVVIGGATSSEAQAMIEIADRFGRLLLSPSASAPELTGVSSNFYRVFPSDFREGSRMANFATQTLGLQKMVIIAEQQDYARGIQSVFTTEFERYGGSVIEVVEYPPNTAELSGLVERAVTLEPQGIYLAGYAEGIGRMIKQLRLDGYQGKILTTSAFAAPIGIETAGDAAADAYLTQTVFEVDSEYAHIQSFVNAYKEKYGEEPDLFAAHGYDTMMVLAEALRDKKPLPSELLKGMRGLSDHPGVTGSISFDERGDVQKYPRVYLINDDLILLNYDVFAKKMEEERRRKQEELQRKMQELRDAMAGG
ncbi:MAG: penicillin-binding protein activator [Acidobacteriota bacterium]